MAPAEAEKNKLRDGFGPALERGSIEAAWAVMNAGGNPINAVAENTAKMLAELKAMNDKLEKLARRTGDVKLVASN